MDHKSINEASTCSLKSLDFVSWRVAKAKKKIHKKEVNRQLSLRPRLRRESVTTH